jgi:hypothetical protein
MRCGSARGAFPDRATVAVIPGASHTRCFSSSRRRWWRRSPGGCGGCRRRERYSAMTVLRSTPIPLISISHTSPGFMFSGMPSVPIHITSPGSMVQYRLTSEI